MQLSAHSDLSTAMQLRRESNSLKTALSSAASEMTTGKVADVVGATGGHLQDILALDHKIELAGIYRQSIGLAQTRAEVAQSAVAVLGDTADTLAPDLLASAGRGDVTSRAVLAETSKVAFGTAIVALNSHYSGRNLFGGAAADGPAVDTAAAILADVSAIVAGQPDAVTAAAAVSFYFNDPAGGFQSTRYFGSAQPGPQIRVGKDEVMPPLPSVLEPGVLAMLEGLALAAVVADGAFAALPAEQVGMIDAAGQVLLAAAGQVQVLREGIGQSEGRLAELQQANSAETAALEMVRYGLVGVDQFDAASRFEALSGQLEISYLASARLSQLTLAAFLR